MPRLENWSVNYTGEINYFQAPEIRARHLNGQIYDDEKGRFPDGSNISTSYIEELNIEEGYAMTRNTKYILGQPSQHYLDHLESIGKTLEDYIR